MTSKAKAAKAMRRWRADPVVFVREVFGAEPDRWQVKALRAVESDPRVAMSACKGPGKSCLLAWIIWWFLATRVDAQIMCLSITADNLKDNLWKELAQWMAESEFLRAAFALSAERITNKERPKTWWCSARAFAKDANKEAQANTLAGFHAKTLMIVLDELGDYPHGVLAAADAIFANEDTAEAKLVAAGNPTNEDGPLGYIVNRDAKRWTVVFISGDPDDPDRSPRISKKWAQEQIDLWGRDNPWVQVNVLGRFPSQPTDKLIATGWVSEAQRRDVDEMTYKSDAYIWGLDPARFGDDEACLMRRQGLVAFRANVWRGLDGPELANRIASMIVDAEAKGDAPDALFVDVGGVGASAFDHLKLLGYERLVHAVEFASSPDDSRFFNKRAEMWWRMREWLKVKPACLPEDPQLATELCAPRYDFRVVSKQTRLILEAKQKMKERGVGSPNRGDALALTFAGNVMTRGLRLQLDAVASNKVKTEYDPYRGLNQTEGKLAPYRDVLHR